MTAASSSTPSAASPVTARVCAIIVSYNPDPSLIANVAALCSQVERVLVVDNASGPDARAVLDELRRHPAVELLPNGTNLGIGAALNRGVRWAMERGYEWVATFDQDSRAPTGFVAGLLAAWAERPDAERIALVAPVHREERSGLLHGPAAATATSAVVATSMMSGNLVRVGAVAAVGFYDESFFIDYVDHEFCLRLARHGYLVLESRRTVLAHNLGRLDTVLIAGRRVTTTNHAPLRRYYNARNRLWVYRRYSGFAPRWVVRDLRSFVLETAKLALRERDRWAKLRNVGRGIWDGLTRPVGGDPTRRRRSTGPAA